jgi:hypothetical protein
MHRIGLLIVLLLLVLVLLTVVCPGTPSRAMFP